MNHIYRIVWNTATACYQAVSESATGQGKGQGKSTVVQGTASGTASDWALTATAIGAALCMLSLPSFAGPAGGQVTAGSATITQAGTATTINQTSNRAAIDWTRFSVGANESVRFNQPSASAITLNRVTGTESSAIMGSLSANGQVFILNPNGVLFGAGAQVNVGGLVASTLQMSNANFMAGNYKFAGDAAGSVVNHGQITVAPGGTLALMAPIVQNTGTLSAPGGSVLLAGAQAVTLTLQSNGGLVSYTLDAGSAQALVDNGGLIQAGGGHVVLTAKGVDALSKAVVNHSGVIEAQTVGSKNGVIELLGDMQSGTVSVSGKLDASAPNADGKGGDGGFIETSATTVKVTGIAKITTGSVAGNAGTWVIDPVDITIDSGIASAISTSLGTGNVTISTTGGNTPSAASGESAGNGDIFVNSAINWSANKLTLSADRNININANLNGSGTAQLALKYGQSTIKEGNAADYFVNNGARISLSEGYNFSTFLGNNDVENSFYVITRLGVASDGTSTTLQGISNNRFGKYALGSDISAEETKNWSNAAGFSPIGYGLPETNYYGFYGEFHGLGNTIKGISINRPKQDYVGLFGNTWLNCTCGISNYASIVRDFQLIDGSIIGRDFVGSAAGRSWGIIKNVTSNVAIVGNDFVGGITGNNGYILKNSSSTGSVTGKNNIGGLIGDNAGEVERSYASGSVIGVTRVGGLIGNNYSNAVRNSYSTGMVSGDLTVGGLVGENYGQLSNSFYNVDETTIFENGIRVQRLTAGGIYKNQYEKWQLQGLKLKVDDYLLKDSDGYYNLSSIDNLKDLLGFAWDPALKVKLKNGIDVTSLSNWHIPIFSGQEFNGNNNAIINFNVNHTTNITTGFVGILSSNSTITDLELKDLKVNGTSYVGGAVGLNFGTLRKIKVSGEVKGTGDAVGGLVGDHSGGTIESSFSNVTVTGNSSVGGLVGHTGYETYAIKASYATGTVTGVNDVGGLIGYAEWYGTLSDSYATGGVKATGNSPYSGTGALIGNSEGWAVHRSYATGRVEGSHSGGLVGTGYTGTATNSYWNAVTTGQSGSFGGGTALTSAQMKQQASYTDWDFVNTWVMLPGNSYPTLRNNPVRVAVVTPDPAIEAARLAAIASAAAAEADRLAAVEAARVVELARQAAIAAAAEAHRLAALEAARVAELARPTALVAEQARLAEVLRLAREVANAEADRLAALEAARVAELARQTEFARLAANYGGPNDQQILNNHESYGKGYGRVAAPVNSVVSIEGAGIQLPQGVLVR